MFFLSQSNSPNHTIKVRRTVLLAAIATLIGAAGFTSNASADALSDRTSPVSASVVKTKPVEQLLIAQSRTREQYYRLQLKSNSQIWMLIIARPQSA